MFRIMRMIARGSEKLARCVELAQFFAARQLLGFAIRDEPYLDDESSWVFRSALRECRFYLEYGSGGSTVLAARLGKRFISVETDQHYLESVRRKIGALAPDQHLIHADVGATGPWGTPFWRRVTRQKLSKWSESLEAPWRLVHGDTPDLILIDGRFRVAATLTCCVHLIASPRSRILVDDYVTNPSYHAIEEYAQLITTIGRMAVFQPSASIGATNLRRAIAEYGSDWR